jgi:predicted phosphohydrolase
MPRLVWITDPHFNFITVGRFCDFVKEVLAHKPDAVLLGGDIGQANSVGMFLRMMAETIGCPIYFVLGNHDFYGSSIAKVCEQVSILCQKHPQLVWLDTAGVVELSKSTALVGTGGWADGRLGDYRNSTVMLNDYRLIEDLAGLTRRQRLTILNRLGNQCATQLAAALPAALEHHPNAIVLTHVPPFREACWREGRISADNWLPHMTCKATGDAILAIMQLNPQRKLTVLCGHSHSAGDAHITDNVYVISSAATYGAPCIARVWEVD